MFRFTSPLVALSIALSSSAVALSAPPSTLSVQLHKSAETIETRVAQRKLQRTQKSQKKITARIRKKTVTPKTSVADTTRNDTARSANRIQQRRALRRAERLAGKPVPIKLQVLDGVNLERAKLGLSPLRYHADLEAAAQAHADDMQERAYFSHESPEGTRVGDRVRKTGYGVVNAQECNCSYRVFLAENIAKGQKAVVQVIADWMNSESHRKEMLSPDYREIGVGLIDDIWVLNFGNVEIIPIRTTAY